MVTTKKCQYWRFLVVTQMETTPMRRFTIDHLIDVNKKVIYAITDITL